jgi:hypothetical protein
MRDARTRDVARITLAGALLTTAGLSTGCDWSLSITQNSLEIVEELLCPECPKGPSQPNVEGGGAPGTSEPGDGPQTGGDEPDDEEPEVNGGGERAAAIVAGRRWRVDALTAELATDHDGFAVVAVSTKVSVAGVEGEATIFVPTGDWPADAEAEPAVFEVGESRVAARQNPSMTIGGKEYILEFVSTTARIDETPAGPRVRGVIEAHAVSLTQAGRADAKKQLVRLSFDADVE